MCGCATWGGKFSWHVKRRNGNYFGDNELCLIDNDGFLFKFRDNLIVQGDFSQKMKAYSAN